MNVSLQVTKRRGFPAMQPDTWRIHPSQLTKEWFGHLHFSKVNLQKIRKSLLKMGDSLCDKQKSQFTQYMEIFFSELARYILHIRYLRYMYNKQQNYILLNTIKSNEEFYQSVRVPNNVIMFAIQF